MNRDDASSLMIQSTSAGGVGSFPAVATDEELFTTYAKSEENFSLFQAVKKTYKEAGKCSGKQVKETVVNTVPILKWLPEYKVKQNLLSDIMSGITVGIVHLPQGMAYSILADLPPVNGLYVSFFPVLIYLIFGSSRHLSVGTFAVVSLMINEALSKHLTECPEQSTSTNTTTVLGNTTTLNPVSASFLMQNTCESDNTNRRLELAVALSLAVAVIHFVMFVFRLGILSVFFSNHMVSGFTCGAAFHVFTSQFPKIFGVKVPRQSGVFSIIQTYVKFFENITTVNWATVILSSCCIVALIIGKKINERFSKKLPFPISWELFVVIFTTLASYYLYLEPNYSVSVVGPIPRGIQTSVPQGSDFLLVFPDAIPIAIVVFSISISLCSVFSEKHAYVVEANQELLAFSLANLCGSFFQCFPCAASLSRSTVWEQSGGKTQLTALFSCVLVLITLLWIGPLFQTLPEAALAAIIIVNLKGMLFQFEKLKPLWKVSMIDAITWLVTWLSVVLLGVDIGLYIGLGFSLFTVVLRTQITFGDVMVAVGPDRLYRSSKRFDGVVDRDILIFKFPSPLIYANQSRFKHQICEALGFTPNFEIAYRKKAETMKKKKSSPTIVKFLPASNTIDGFSAKQDFRHEAESISNHQSPKSTSGMRHRQADIPKDRIASTDVVMPQFVILDMSICPFIDNDGVLAVTALLKSLSKLNIRLLLARCSADVRKCLLNGKFPVSDPHADDEPLFFVNLDRAVEYAEQHKSDTGGDGNGSPTLNRSQEATDDART